MFTPQGESSPFVDEKTGRNSPIFPIFPPPNEKKKGPFCPVSSPLLSDEFCIQQPPIARHNHTGMNGFSYAVLSILNRRAEEKGENWAAATTGKREGWKDRRRPVRAGWRGLAEYALRKFGKGCGFCQ